MAELMRIQKTLRRLKVLFAICAVLCLIAALFAVIAAVIWGIVGESYVAGGGGFFLRVAEALDFGGKGVTLGLLIMDAAAFTALGFLLVATVRCLRSEIKEGTPFSDKGARRTKTLGFLYFFVSLATEMFAVIMRESFSVSQAESLGIVDGMATGVTLLIMSSFIRYGTRLQDMLLLKDVPMPEPIESDESLPEEEETDGSGEVSSFIAKLIAEADEDVQGPEQTEAE